MSDRPSFAWVDDAAALLQRPDASMALVAEWFGAEPDDSLIRVGAGALPGAVSVFVVGADGVPDSLNALYEEHVPLAAAEETLGRARELPRLALPYQVAFPDRGSSPVTCSVVGSTYDPPGAERRLAELTVRRDVAG